MATAPKYRRVPCATCVGAGTIRAINGAYLRGKRERAGLTQAHLARALGVTSQFLSRIEGNWVPCPARFLTAYESLKKPV